MNLPVREFQDRLLYVETSEERKGGEAIQLTQILDMTLTRQVPVSDFREVDHVFIWLFEEGLGQRINRMAQRWLREGKKVTVLSDRTLPLPEGVTVYVITHGSHASLANGYIHKQLNENTCEGERCFSSSRMYTPYKELIRAIEEGTAEKHTGLSTAKCERLYTSLQSAKRAGHYFPHEEMTADKVQQFRSILMIPLLEMGCKRDLSLRILIGDGKAQVFGRKSTPRHKPDKTLSIWRGPNPQKSGQLLFDFYSYEISDAFDVDPLPIG